MDSRQERGASASCTLLLDCCSGVVLYISATLGVDLLLHMPVLHSVILFAHTLLRISEFVMVYMAFAGNSVPGSTECHCPFCYNVLPGLILCGEPGLSCPQVSCCTKLQVYPDSAITVECLSGVNLYCRPTFQVYTRYTCKCIWT